MKRFRQFRATSELRDIYSEVPPILADDLIYPYFVNNGNGVRDEIVSLPGVYELSPDTLVKDVGEIRALGLNKILLFGVVPEEAKNETGSAAWDPEGPVPSAIRAVKEKYPEITVIADVCLCGYTSHGHCGLHAPAPCQDRCGVRCGRRGLRRALRHDGRSGCGHQGRA